MEYRRLMQGYHMLDPGYVYTNLQDVRDNCRKRNVPADVLANVERVAPLIVERNKFISEKQLLEQRRNEVSKLVPKEKDPTARQNLIAEGRSLGDKIADLDNKQREIEADLTAMMLTLPNLTHPEAPVGALPEDNKVIKKVGEPRTFDFKPLDHVALAEKLDLV